MVGAPQMLGRLANEPAAQVRLDLVGVRLQVISRLFSHFATTRQRMGIDSDSQQILLAFKLAGLAEASRGTDTKDRFDAASFFARLNASTISSMTGIPRETVRRKLLKLCATGVLSSGGRGSFVMDRYWPELDAVDTLDCLFKHRSQYR